MLCSAEKVFVGTEMLNSEAVRVMKTIGFIGKFNIMQGTKN